LDGKVLQLSICQPVHFDKGFADVHPEGAKGRADEDKCQKGIETALSCFGL
jgi:hypothetical protein